MSHLLLIMLACYVSIGMTLAIAAVWISICHPEHFDQSHRDLMQRATMFGWILFVAIIVAEWPIMIFHSLQKRV